MSWCLLTLSNTHGKVGGVIFIQASPDHEECGTRITYTKLSLQELNYKQESLRWG